MVKAHAACMWQRSDVALTLRDLPREDDVFEIEDGEVVIFKLFGGMG